MHCLLCSVGTLRQLCRLKEAWESSHMSITLTTYYLPVMVEGIQVMRACLAGGKNKTKHMNSFPTLHWLRK